MVFQESKQVLTHRLPPDQLVRPAPLEKTEADGKDDDHHLDGEEEDDGKDDGGEVGGNEGGDGGQKKQQQVQHLQRQ